MYPHYHILVWEKFHWNQRRWVRLSTLLILYTGTVKFVNHCLFIILSQLVDPSFLSLFFIPSHLHSFIILFYNIFFSNLHCKREKKWNKKTNSQINKYFEILAQLFVCLFRFFSRVIPIFSKIWFSAKTRRFPSSQPPVMFRLAH